jgi:Ca2+-binding RTX toxin-like protein
MPVPIRLSLATALTLGLIFLPATTASGASCSYDAATRTVQITAGANEQAGLIRSGSAIRLNGAPCGGATVANTDTIRVTNPAGASGEGGNLFLDLRGGLFEPGMTDEPGSSDEIEFIIDLGPGRDGIAVFPGDVTHTITAGQSGSSNHVNLNAHETDGIDADITFTNTDYMAVFWNAEYGATGVDSLIADGSASTGGAPASMAINASGGPGGDVLIGGTGTNTFFGQEGNDRLGGGGGTDQLYGGVDSDSLRGGSGDDHLAGEEGPDNLNGGPGTEDFCRGGPARDTFRACERTIQ